MQLPQPYRLPTIILLCALLLAGVVYCLLLLPLQQRLEQAKSNLNSLEQRLNTAKWPADAEVLRQMLKEQEDMLEGTSAQPGVLARNRQAFRRANSLFVTKIAQRYDSQGKFLQGVSRLDYQEDLANFQSALRQDKFSADAQSLNLAEDAAETPTYQLLLQLWAVEALWRTCREVGLQPLKDKQGKILLALLAPISYFDKEVKLQDGQRPYLLELPIHFTVQGTPEQITILAGKLLQQETFLPLRHFTIETFPRLADGKLAVNARLTATCSAFFLPEDDDAYDE